MPSTLCFVRSFVTTTRNASLVRRTSQRVASGLPGTSWRQLGLASNPPARTTTVTGTANRRRAAAIAALLTISSSTALATSSSSNQDSIPERGVNGDHPRHLESNKTANAASESADICTSQNVDMIPEFLLQYDTYNGVIIHLDHLMPDYTPKQRQDESLQDYERRIQEHRAIYDQWTRHPETFAAALEGALLQWKQQGRKRIWIHMPGSLADVVPACIKLGFDFHSCHNQAQPTLDVDANNNKKSGTSTMLVLSQWLPDDVESRLPIGPYFQAGVGCVLLHPDDPSKMLVVQEVTGPAAARKLWKMPTGLMDPGEDVADAALRELEEETGLTGAQCEGVLCFRQAHGSAQRPTSDWFFVVLLRLLPDRQRSKLDNLRPQEHEILDIKWMPVKEYANQETWQSSPLYQEVNQSILDAVEHHKSGKAMPVITAQKLPVGFWAGSNTVYRS